MKVKSTLKVINQKNYKGRRGVTDGQTYQRLVGWPEVFMTDRVRLGRATYKPGTYEQLHWHPIEACYYIISGHATVRDINGKDTGQRRLHHYAPPGIAGAHEWEVRSHWSCWTSAPPMKPTGKSRYGGQEDQAFLHRPQGSRLSRGDQFQVSLLRFE